MSRFFVWMMARPRTALKLTEAAKLRKLVQTKESPGTALQSDSPRGRLKSIYGPNPLHICPCDSLERDIEHQTGICWDFHFLPPKSSTEDCILADWTALAQAHVQ